MTEKLYIRNGRKFEPLHELRYHDAFQEGSWLVTVGPGNTSTRRCLDPAHAEVEAAMHVAAEAMKQAMVEYSKPRPDVELLTKEQREAWARLRDALGGEVGWISASYPSVHDIVQAGIEALREEMQSG